MTFSLLSLSIGYCFNQLGGDYDKCHKLGDLQSRNLFLTVVEAVGEFGQFLARLSYGLLTAFCLCLPLAEKVCKYSGISPFKRALIFSQGLHPHDLIIFQKAPCPNPSYWRFGFKYVNLRGGETQIFISSWFSLVYQAISSLMSGVFVSLACCCGLNTYISAWHIIGPY